MSGLADRFFDERMEMLPPDLLRKLQDHRLRWQFRRCWDGSAWYRERFEAAGLSPETFGGLADLERLPLLDDLDLLGLDSTVWRVAPAAWTEKLRWLPSAAQRRETDGDVQHQRDRRGRANWARVKSSVFDDWPADDSTRETVDRRFWPNELRSSDRVKTYALDHSLVGGLLAFECVERRGRHWVEDQLLAEIINPRTGHGVPDGATGELIVTDLVREANPLIRYRTGRRLALVREQCACGRTSARLWTAEQVRTFGSP